ncbi:MULTISPECIES: heme oxygenase (biliverdin-producing) [Cyanophyceae]|uniref:biliverdin-producing heme oxygenase n=1 Tax=Cyanophyceae TaxID=3028117 RepID=UPI00232D6D07|nr:MULTISPECIES: heme oxygenase (biliverdin-producing) [Cyanophyceae]MDB9318981.1 heme oxygenase (biliverdin-producing) [Nodularia spumigena CS-590/01A]MDB9322737.1 heme oxygenase (biliverdin-producing) [Nodularia spumigena CS-591/07A]MDB9326908.1 heme oxygenase (biliverdin-producing) [Nodularia spumigena CS-590/02]MDB9330801.1 heme oxygenase (biliverdin-producing) [Nodularia spumigena CS-591/04]MDB9335074.1 heme oxygenase (biliverdin-producing) [Nodularia spumigena CS-590/01]
MSSNLASKLRLGTKKAHTMAENVGFVKCFLKGVVEKNSYRKLVANFYFIYSAMEEEMEKHRQHPIIGKINFVQLNRKHTLEQDLSYYFGANWREEVKLSPAGAAYVQRIREISQTAPELLIAHSYTRYLGDLSGGQILKNIAVTAMNLSEGQGTAFYEFADITDEKAFKAKYRQTLDELPLDDTTGDRIVDEANDAFGMNMKMFQELEGNLIKSIGVMLFNSLLYKY